MSSTYASVAGLQVKMVGTIFDSATSALAEACIIDAQEEIKKKLSKRFDFTTGLFDTATSRPVIIQTICETLALGYMYENMARGSKEGMARADRYIKRGMDNLSLIAIGDADLIDPSGLTVAQISTDWAVKSTTQDYANTFNEDDQKKWKVDKTKLEDIESERS